MMMRMRVLKACIRLQPGLRQVLTASPYHTRVALCKLLHLLLQSLCGLQLIHQLHLQEGDACWGALQASVAEVRIVRCISMAVRLSGDKMLPRCECEHLQCHRPAAGLQGVLIRPWDPPDLVRDMEPGDCRGVTLGLVVVWADDGCNVQLLMARPASHMHACGHAQTCMALLRCKLPLRLAV